MATWHWKRRATWHWHRALHSVVGPHSMMQLTSMTPPGVALRSGASRLLPLRRPTVVDTRSWNPLHQLPLLEVRRCCPNRSKPHKQGKRKPAGIHTQGSFKRNSCRKLLCCVKAAPTRKVGRNSNIKPARSNASFATGAHKQN